MPSALRPVPSKAAIRALRGLALGTSCAIGLIVEDRRRRINTLRTAVRNQKKLRASRAYHGGAEVVTLPMDTPAVVSGDDVRWQYRQDCPGKLLHSPIDKLVDSAAVPSGNAPRAAPEKAEETREGEMATQPVRTEAHREAQLLLPLPGPPPDPPPGPPRGDPRSRPSNSSNGSFSAFRNPARHTMTEDGIGLAHARSRSVRPKQTTDQNTIVHGIMKLLESPNADLDGIIRDFLGEIQRRDLVFDEDGMYRDDWLKLSAALCRHCQRVERWQDAQTILVCVLRAGSVREERFYDHDPIPLIEMALSAAESGQKISDLKHLQVALRLFLAKFEHAPTTHADEFVRLGRTLITRLLAYNQPQACHKVYWRASALLEGVETSAFTAWYIKSLFDYRDHKSVIKYFNLNFSKVPADQHCFEHVFDMVVQSVEAMRGAKSHNVARALARMADAPEGFVKTGWLVRLASANWSRHRDAAETKELFDEFLKLGLLDRVAHPEHVYRIMVQFAAQSGQHDLAHEVYDALVSKFPHMASDLGLIGHLALVKAQLGDWGGVLSHFTKMEPGREEQPFMYQQTFIQVLKVFAGSHTTVEVEKFVKYYHSEMQMPLHRYIVGLVGNKYGQDLDHEGFINWLKFCCTMGFALEPGFCNTVLHNCRTKWKFDFRKLRGLFWAMRALDERCVDRVTLRIMHNAALVDGRPKRAARLRVRSLRMPLNRSPYFFRSADEREVFEVMNEELLSGFPSRVVLIYKRALRYGMPWCPRCFRVAVTAAIRRGGANVGEAINLIFETHQQGHNVAQAVEVFIKAQIDRFRGPFDEVMANLRSVISRFEALGILIDTTVLTHTALMSVKFGQHARAVSLCKMAMEKVGTANPCFSRQSLRALLLVYQQNFDVEGTRWLVEALPSSPLAADEKSLQLLKQTRRHLRQWKPTEAVVSIAELLESAIAGVKERRQEAAATGTVLYQETIRIMTEAVADAENGRARGQRQMNSGLEEQEEEEAGLQVDG